MVGNKRCYICINPKGTSYHPKCLIAFLSSIRSYFTGNTKFQMNVQYFTLPENNLNEMLKEANFLNAGVFVCLFLIEQGT